MAHDNPVRAARLSILTGTHPFVPLKRSALVRHWESLSLLLPLLACSMSTAASQALPIRSSRTSVRVLVYQGYMIVLLKMLAAEFTKFLLWRYTRT